MSWIVKDLWETLDNRRGEFEALWADRSLRAFETINWIASGVGERWGVLIQINFPPGQERPDVSRIGRRNVSILVDKNKKRFETISEEDIKKAVQSLNPRSFDPARFGQEGFRANLASGRIDCLASGVHLWCDITPEILEFLDWIFVTGYSLSPPS
ncbi:MAG TPA: hypothetical protein VFE96_08785 [Candidatus Bathyarchaeia archaeon]|nr:hypothetical protein [Candidatus Bathyarchaeia archaeon]